MAVQGASSAAPGFPAERRQSDFRGRKYIFAGLTRGQWHLTESLFGLPGLIIFLLPKMLRPELLLSPAVPGRGDFAAGGKEDIFCTFILPSY
ncbi:MAG TPA: hypothetical protein VHA56_00475 [Mucilaginibacter sp.]|nr:hypothetical protein [Mucilaginibacter sp.]